MTTAPTENELIDHRVFARADDFGDYHSATDRGVYEFQFTPEQLQGTSAEWREQVLKSWVAPPAEEPVTIDWAVGANAAALYKSLDSRFREQMEARKVVARALLDAERDPSVTKEEAEAFKTSNPVLVHAHRVRSLFGVSMSVLEGWVVEFEEGTRNVKNLLINRKEVAAAILEAEEARLAEAARRAAEKAARDASKGNK